MDKMGWLCRNIEFISPEAISSCLLSFSEVKNESGYEMSLHTSRAIISVIQLIKHTKMRKPRDDHVNSHLAIQLSILEPLLLNQ